MRGARAFFSRLAELWRKDRRERELDDEMSSLVEMEVASRVAKGMPEGEARRTALMRVSAENTKEQYRDRRGLPIIEKLLQDMRFGFRMLRENPGFTAVALITLALGIGANTAMFSAIDSVLLRRLPFRDPERLVMVWEKNPSVGGFLAERLPVRMQSYLAWKERARSFEDMSAAIYDAVNVSGTDRPQHLERAEVSSNFLPVLGVHPALGRTFTPEETNGAPARVAMISYGMYEAQFGKAANILDRDIEIEGVPHRIVGVLPQGFHLGGMWGGFDRAKPEVWTPLNTSPNQSSDRMQANNLMVYGRLKPGVTLEQARSEMALIGKQMEREFPKEYDKFGTNVFSVYTEDVAQNLRKSLLVLQLAVGFVLLLACANVANLLLARAASRQREIVVRLALGASRGRVMQQLVSESVVLSAVGAIPGLALAWAGIRLIGRLAPEDVPGLHELSLDPKVLAFTALIALAAGVLFGIAPALHAWGEEGVCRPRAAGVRVGLSQRLRNALVVAEVALALAPLAGAGLMIRTLNAMNALDLGIRPEHVVDGRLNLPEISYKDEAKVRGFGNQLLERAAALPGVESVALAGSPPMQSIGYTSFHLDGESVDREQAVDAPPVSDGYFRTMGAPILRGRDFTRAEAEQDADVAIVTQSLAQRLWPGQDALGRAIIFGEKKPKRRVVVGIVPDTRILIVGTDVHDAVYFPTRNLRYLTLIVRAEGKVEQVESALSTTVREMDPTLPLYDVHPLTQVVREGVMGQRFTMTLLIVFAGLALALAAVGLYGVLAYSVAQRTQEIGVRMALGARSADVLRMIVKQALAPVMIGMAIGIGGSLLLTRAMASLLFGIREYDPRTFVSMAAVLFVTALAASYVPARRAAKVDPMVALRWE